MPTEAEIAATAAVEATKAAEAAAEAAKKKPETVSREDHERALADLHKFKTVAKELADEKKKSEETKLKETNDWKTLAEKREQEAKDATEKSDRLQASYIDDKKFNAIRAATDALNLRPEALSDLEALDFSKVQVETTSTGKINVLGAKEFAENLKALKPHWFGDKSGPRINTDGTRVRPDSGAITPQALLKAEAEGRKTGDMSGYQALHKKYQTQRAAARR